MICRPKNGLEIQEDFNNVFLFYQCINEMTFDYSPDTYKAKILNTHSLCRELLETYEALYQTGNEEKYFKRYMTIIIDELLDNLKDDTSAKKILGGRYERIIALLNEGKENKGVFESTIRNLNGYFDGGKYYYAVISDLVKAISGKRNQKEIIRLSGVWISELLLIGYSKQHIYNMVNEFFSNRSIEKSDEIIEFFGMFNFEPQKWEFIMFVDDRLLMYLKNLSKITEMNNLHLEKMELDELVALAHQQGNKSFETFLTKAQLLDKLYKTKILKCMCSSLDPYMGMKRIQGYFKFFTNIVVTVDNEPQSYYSECVCLNYNKTIIKIKNAMERRNRTYSQSYLPSVIKLLKSMNVSDEIYQLLMNVFAYHGDAITAGLDNKYALTMLWTALETLFVNDNHNTNKGETVKHALVNILQRTYIIKCLKYLHSDFVANVKATNSCLIKRYKLDEFPFFVEAMFDVQDSEKYNDLLKTLESNPLLRTRIFCLIDQNFSTGESIIRLLDSHKEKIERQIDRIYRNRNFLIHAGQEFWYEEEIVECLHNYLDFVINYLIVKMEAGESIIDIYDVIEEAKVDNEIHNKMLSNRKKEKITKDNYKEFLFGPSDNVLSYYETHAV